MEIIDQIKAVLGKKFDPEAEYVVETHRGAQARSDLWKPVCEIMDGSLDQSGTMVVMVRTGK